MLRLSECFLDVSLRQEFSDKSFYGVKLLSNKIVAPLKTTSNEQINTALKSKSPSPKKIIQKTSDHNKGFSALQLQEHGAKKFISCNTLLRLVLRYNCA